MKKPLEPGVAKREFDWNLLACCGTPDHCFAQHDEGLDLSRGGWNTKLDNAGKRTDLGFQGPDRPGG
jgi:hypothetical protein